MKNLTFIVLTVASFQVVGCGLFFMVTHLAGWAIYGFLNMPAIILAGILIYKVKQGELDG